MDVLVEAKALIATDQYRVLIIDSAMALFRVDYTGRGELADRQQKLNKYLPALLFQSSNCFKTALVLLAERCAYNALFRSSSQSRANTMFSR